MNTKPIIVIATWGIGPSYKKCVCEYVEEMISNNILYDLHIVIMTDDVNYVTHRLPYDEVKRVVNVHDLRSQYQQNTTEFIPNTLDASEYRMQMENNMNQYNQTFSYNIKRFLFPVLAEMGYNKFFIADPDHIIIFTDKLLEAVNIEENCISGILHHEIKIDVSTPPPWAFVSSGALGYESYMVFADYRWFLQLVLNKLGMDKYAPSAHNGIDLSEGPLRLFHFRNIDDVLLYFTYWNTIVEIAYSSRELQYFVKSIGELMSDFMPVSMAAKLMNMKFINFDRSLYDPRVYNYYKIFPEYYV